MTRFEQRLIIPAMMKFWLPRILLGLLFAFALTYTIVREINDRAFTHKVLGTLGLKSADAPEPTSAPDHAAVTENEGKLRPPVSRQSLLTNLSPQSPAPANLPEELEANFRAVHTALSQSFDQQLRRRLDAQELGREADAATMTTVQQTLAGMLERMVEEQITRTRGLAGSVERVDQSLAELESAQEDLEAARTAWSETYRQLSRIGEFSGNALRDENYRFETYEVGSRDTLNSVANYFTAQTGLNHADFESLISLHNNIQTRLIPQGSRRGPLRVISNPTLRVPIPLSAADLLEDAGVPASLAVQREAMTRAQSRQRTVSASVESELTALRQIVSGLDGMTGLARLMQTQLSDLEPSALPPLDEIDPAQQEAWENFDRQLNAFAHATDSEGRRRAEAALAEASENLLRTFATPEFPDDTLNTDGALRPLSDGSTPDLEWYQNLLRRYGPEGLENGN